MKKISLLLFLVFMFAASCKKYEEGPRVNFLTKKYRLVKSWQIQDYYYINKSGGTYTKIDVTLSMLSSLGYYRIEYKEDGTFENTRLNDIYRGFWKFSKDKEYIVNAYVDISLLDSLKIIRLTNKELWITKNQGKEEIHFIK